jgi:hypothetical protein
MMLCRKKPIFKVSRLRFTAGDLKHLDLDEAPYVIMAGHLANEISALNKLVLYTTGTYANPANRDASAVWGLMLIRLLGGKLYEGWEMVKRQYFGSKVSATQAGRSELDFVEHQKWLKKYFGDSKNLIHKLRNQYAFHYSVEEAAAITSHLNTVDPDHPLELLLTNAHGNSWYIASEDVVLHAMAKDWKTGSIKKTVDKLMADITEVTGHFLKFLGGTMENSLVHLGDLGVEISREDEQIADVPGDGEFQLQFFTNLKGKNGKPAKPGG